MKEVMKWGYHSEQDLFIARACLEMLCRGLNTDLAKQIFNNFIEEKNKYSILDFVEMIIEAIELKDLKLFVFTINTFKS